MQSKKKDVNFLNGNEKPEPDRAEIHNAQINMQKTRKGHMFKFISQKEETNQGII